MEAVLEKITTIKAQETEDSGGRSAKNKACKQKEDGRGTIEVRKDHKTRFNDLDYSLVSNISKMVFEKLSVWSLLIRRLHSRILGSESHGCVLVTSCPDFDCAKRSVALSKNSVTRKGASRWCRCTTVLFS